MHSVIILALSKPMDGCTHEELFTALRLLLKHYVCLQGTQGNQKKVPTVRYMLLLSALDILAKKLGTIEVGRIHCNMWIWDCKNSKS